MIYGHNSDNPGKIVQIDLSGTSTTLTALSGKRWSVDATLLNLSTSSQLPHISNVGAAFFNGINELLLYGIHSGAKQNQLFSATPLISGSVALSTLGVSTGPFGASDGTSCAYSPRFTKTVSPNPATPGSTVTYTYIITNNQYSDFTVDFSDNFDSNLTVTSYTYNNSTVPVSGNSVTIGNIVVPANSSVTFTVTATVNSDITNNMTVNNQATLTGVSEFPVNTLLSDEPNIPGFENPTPLDIQRVDSHETGQICGYKFNDLNGNGIWDHGNLTSQPETGLAGWDISVTDANGNLVGTATTDASGHYCIEVPASSMPYTVTENEQSQGNNWVQTAPAVSHHVSIPSAGLTAEENDFGNKSVESHRRGKICGHKYQGKETNYPLSGWVVTITGIGGNVVGTATTNEQGEYCISLPPGTYTVSEQIPTMNNVVWTPISPASGYYSGVWVGPSTSVNGKDFHNLKKTYGPVGSDNNPAGMLGPVTKTHSPQTFSTGSKGTFSIKVTNKGKTLTRGMLKVSDHMPAGLTVQSGKFRADLWTCEGGMVSSSGQDVICVFNKRLRKNRWSAIKLDTSIAPNNQFPVGVNIVRNCATATVYGAAGVVTAKSQTCDEVRINHVDSKGAAIPGVFLPAVSPPNVSIEKKHSPSHFSTGSRGAFKIIVKNLGKKLEKGALTLVDHMPEGLSVRTGTFRAGSWLCHGGMISDSGQDITCSYNRALNKRGRATLNLNASVAPKAQFPADVDAVENCATASAQGSAGVKACDRVMIRSVSKSRMPDLAPLGGLIMQMPRGGGGAAAPVRKTPGAVP